jgi:glycerol-3-phosphate dehydrogenase
MLGLGMKLYDRLTGKSSLPKSETLSNTQVKSFIPTRKTENRLGGLRYDDGQMDDRKLGLGVAEQCRQAGVVFNEEAPVVVASPEGTLALAKSQPTTFDCIPNIAGPWAEKLLIDSGIKARYGLDAVRGSQLIVERARPHALLLEVPGGKRIFFALPWQGRSLIGTTEVRQTLEAPIACNDEEADDLLKAYKHFQSKTIARANIVETFAGIRPPVKSASDPNRARGDKAFQRNGRLLTVFGGKSTTRLARAEKLQRKLH